MIEFKVGNKIITIFNKKMKENKLVSIVEKLYVLLGDKEKEAKNKIFSTVENKTIELVN